MSKADWSKAPESAEFYCGEYFYKTGSFEIIKFFKDNKWNESAMQSRAIFMQQDDYEDRPTISVKPTEWPDESRIDIVATNGNTGEHYEAAELTTAADFLSAGLEILSQRGEQYGNDGRECSFPQAAEAFNALTGHKLVGSDICLIIALVKQVRQYAQPGRFHEDSAVDGVNYLALQSELLKKERK